MPDKPSWYTSTLAQLAAASMVSYLAACLVLVAGGGWYKSMATVLVGFNGLRWAVEVLVIGYLARNVLPSKNGNVDQVAEPPKPTEVKP